jgi:hypothetical protein
VDYGIFGAHTIQVRTGGIAGASALISGCPVAKLVNRHCAGVFLGQLNNRQISNGLRYPVPPRQIWCTYAWTDAAPALVVTSPLAYSDGMVWSGDEVGRLLSALMPELMKGGPRFETKQVTTSAALAYLVGPPTFIDSAEVEWVTG